MELTCCIFPLVFDVIIVGYGSTLFLFLKGWEEGYSDRHG